MCPVPCRLSPKWLFSNPCTWAHNVRLHIAATNEPKSAQLDLTPIASKTEFSMKTVKAVNWYHRELHGRCCRNSRYASGNILFR